MPELSATFVVADGRVINLSSHLSQLRKVAGLTPAQLDEIRATIRSYQAGTYRVKVTAKDGAFHVSKRPMERISKELTASAGLILDERVNPHVRGADEGWENRQLASMKQRGATTGLLADATGQVISSIRSPLVLLHGSHPGVVQVSRHPRATPSTTLNAAVDIVSGMGVDIVDRPEGFRFGELRRGEVWVCNSVWLVRRITGWREYGTTMPAHPISPELRGSIPDPVVVSRRMWSSAEEV